MSDTPAIVWRLIVACAAIAALAASTYLAVADVYAGSVTEARVSAGPPVATYSVPPRPVAGETLAEANGSRVYLVLLIPVVLACIPLVFRTPFTRLAGSTVSAVSLVGFVVLTGFSIGLLYGPAAILATLGALAAGVAAFTASRARAEHAR